MEPVEYVRLLRRRWRVVAACVVVAVAAAWLTSPSQEVDPVVDWAASHTLVRDPEVSSPIALPVVGLLATTGEVPRRVAETTGFEGQPAVLARRIQAEPNVEVGSLVLSATARTPEAAAELANVWATELLAYLGDQGRIGSGEALTAAEARVEALRAEIDELGRRIAAAGPDAPVLQAERDAKLLEFTDAFQELERLRQAPAPRAGYVSVEAAIPELARATNAGFSAPQSRTTRALIGAFIGTILGIALLLVLERVDPRLRTRARIEAAFQLPVLAAVPRLNRKQRAVVVTASQPGSLAAEAYRSVRSGVLLMGLHVLAERSVPGEVVERAAGGALASRTEPTVILVTSPGVGEGKSTTTANLAAVFAETGRSVLVLGVDFRRPTIHTFFGVEAGTGLTDVLAGGPGAPRLADVTQATNVAGVRIVTNGRAVQGFGNVAATGRNLVEEARTLADIVLIDTPPLLATNDAVELIPAVDSVVLVARGGRTTTDAARQARDLIARLSAPVAGVVFNGAPREGSYDARYYAASTPDAAEESTPTDAEPVADGVDSGDGGPHQADDREDEGEPDRDGTPSPAETRARRR